MPRVSSYPNKQKPELNKFFRLFGTNDNNSNSPQVNVPIDDIKNYVTEGIVDEVKEIIITQLQPQYHYFDNKTDVFIEHGLEKYPNVTVMIGTEEVIPHEINHSPDRNSLTVIFTQLTTGLIVIQ